MKSHTLPLLACAALGAWAALSPEAWFRIAGLVVAGIVGVTTVVLAVRAERRAAERRSRAMP